MSRFVLDVPEDLAEKLDERVSELKAVHKEKEKLHRKMRLDFKLTQDQRHEMHRLANTKGAEAANAYSRNIYDKWKEASDPGRVPSRTSVVLDMVRFGLGVIEPPKPVTSAASKTDWLKQTQERLKRGESIAPPQHASKKKKSKKRRKKQKATLPPAPPSVAPAA